MFYEPSTGKLFQSLNEFRQAYQHTSFGDLLSEDERNAVGLFSVKMDRPSFDPVLQTVEQTGVTLVDGIYTAKYTITDKPLSAEERLTVMLQRLDAALTTYLDSVAQSRRYDNRITLAVRAGYPNDWQAEAIAFGTWMDKCNKMAYQFMQEVLAGTRPCPTDSNELLAALPPMVWPAAV